MSLTLSPSPFGPHLAEHHHLALVAVRAEVAFEAVLVTALLAAHLAVPSQLLQALRLDAVRDLRRAQHLRPGKGYEHGRNKFGIPV